LQSTDIQVESVILDGTIGKSMALPQLQNGYFYFWNLWKNFRPDLFSKVNLQGDFDPNTPLQGAIYHLESQAQSSRTFILVGGAGHGAFSLGLSDCKSLIIEDIVNQIKIKDVSSFSKCANKKIQLFSLPTGVSVKDDNSTPFLKSNLDQYLDWSNNSLSSQISN
jgi:hypothetical protein